MSELECDDCGTMNREGAKACELCGESLEEEVERKKYGNPWVLGPMAIGATLLLVVLPGALVLSEYGVLGLLGYAVAWGVLAVVGRTYQGRDDYYLGWGGGFSRVDNPFTFQDDYDRAHLAIGIVLMPVLAVTGLWGSFARALQARRPV